MTKAGYHGATTIRNEYVGRVESAMDFVILAEPGVHVHILKTTSNVARLYRKN